MHTHVFTVKACPQTGFALYPTIIGRSAGQGIGKHFEVKFTATNLLNAPYNFTQGKDARDDNIVQKYTIGSTFSLGASYTY